MACTSDDPKTEAATTISAVHPDIIHANILSRLDGAALASVASSCSQFRTLSSHEDLWSNACHSTWPSTTVPRVRQVISTFPSGSRSFFADSSPAFSTSTAATDAAAPDHTPELISAVDIFHGDRNVLSKVVETQTGTEWFQCSPFRVDMLDRKDVVRTGCREDTCRDLRVSWIVIDPAGRRAVNVSSEEAVCVEEQWLSGEVRSRFATVVTGERGMVVAMCSVVVVTWWRGGGEEVREVSLQVEDMDGMVMNGRDSLVILKRVLEGERRRGKKEGLCSLSYREFVKMKKEREEEKVRAEMRLDMLLCAGLIALTFPALFVLEIGRPILKHKS